MEQRTVGRSGLRVSSLGLGTMGWGGDGITDADEARDLLVPFVEAGGTLVDTADVYGGGTAEQLLGELLDDVVLRDDVVLVAKSGRGRRPGPDTSARALLSGLDASLRRLGTDHVDVWMVHTWDPATPPEEVAAALALAVSSGRVRYAGVGDHSGWQIATAAAAARSAGQPLVAAGCELSVLAGDHADVLPAAAHHGLGVLAWAPLGRGVLTGKYRTSTPSDSRGASEHLAAWVQPYLGPGPRRVAQAVATAADGLGVAPLEVALAWVRDHPGVASAVVGARTPGQLLGSLAATELELPAEIRAVLDELSAG
ncbi:Predicted oxidoreductase [Quadrisphaera granulorum]|uniref:Aryl-alcohol dehydrogenase-like predicted oxidoreductase n=1 Tax=Quadrisphaera granulorum TaxID=317664 RepID=A0A316A6R9_9ACTN|nr:aldo/keto reductase [Quadrisphaera granulorum]PWJ53139.1 aryl-alcohol dehydrogenase-like predicted oxidoreductase [Quadrisphaera granulorum]SZE97071.1 Predicted oxidoreductase [Quadrisphaera granulorum]